MEQDCLPAGCSGWFLDCPGMFAAYVPLHQERIYTAAAWLTAAVGVGEAVIIAGANGYFSLAKSDHQEGGITFEAAKAKNFGLAEDNIDSPPI